MTRLAFAVMVTAGVLLFAEPGFAAATPRTCPTGITKDMVINYNDDVSCQLDVIGEIDFYRFQGTAGEQIQITMSGIIKGPCFNLFDPTNTSVQEVCQAAPGVGVVSAAFTLAKTGTYTIRAYDYGFDQTFHYRIYLERYSPPLGALAIAYGQNQAGRIEPAEEVDQWVFVGTSGDQIGIQVTNTLPKGPCFDLWQPDGTLMGTFCNGSPGGTLIRSEFTLLMSGTYLIRVYDLGLDSTWDYNLFLQCLGTCTIGTLGIPTLSIALTGCTTCANGDNFVARLNVVNMPTAATELKVGLYLPDKSQVPAVYPHLELPSGFTFDGEILRGPITASQQRGTWMLCGRVIGLAGGDILAASCQTFTIAP